MSIVNFLVYLEDAGSTFLWNVGYHVTTQCHNPKFAADIFTAMKI
jgi:hypothetical protein